jgi:hypothetical protein
VNRKSIDEVRKREASSGVGEVGIFWFFKGEILPSSVPCKLGEQYGDFINGKSDHCTHWNSIRRSAPGAAQYEYDQVPRGRVVYSKNDDRFLVYGSEEFIVDEWRKAVVISAFKLPPDRTTFKADEHYGRIPGMLDDD